ncbi:MAG: LamG domain-containing protein [Chlorobi bacterium]|nr:LamG domain-containing protein [Chlorobiota bacterium]
MKKIYLTLIFGLLTVAGLQAQTLLAFYPFSSNGVDTTGNNEDAYLKNVTFSNGGVYSNGIYNGNDTTGSVIQTPSINNFNFDDFTVLLDFYVEEYPDFDKPIIIGGPSWRWLGAYMDENGILTLMANDKAVFIKSEKSAALNTWNTLALSYEKNTGQLRLYLNSILIADGNVQELTHNNDGKFVNDHRGEGQTFKGYWRNLKIYNSSVVAGIDKNNELKGIQVLRVRGQLKILIPENEKSVEMQVVDMNGNKLSSNVLTSGKNLVNISEIRTGSYLLLFVNRSGQQAVEKITVVR